MPLVLSRPRDITQGQFGVNESASATTVGNAVGTIFTRHCDAGTFVPLAAQYGIRFTRLPDWLRDVKFDRSGIIHRYHQRRVRVEITMKGIWRCSGVR